MLMPFSRPIRPSSFANERVNGSVAMPTRKMMTHGAMQEPAPKR